MTQYKPEHLREYASYLEGYMFQKEEYEKYCTVPDHEKRNYKHLGEDPGELESLEKAIKRYEALDAIQELINEAESWANTLRNHFPSGEEELEARKVAESSSSLNVFTKFEKAKGLVKKAFS